MSDQTTQHQQDEQSPAAKKRVPTAQRIPQATITQVTPVIAALAGFNGPASKKMVAGAMGVSASTGKFRGQVGDRGLLRLLQGRWW